GLPVLSSKASCLPEILEHSALYFDPQDQNDLLTKMEDIIANKNLRDLLIAKGYQQIKKYSWEKMAQETLRIYNQ
ncbi:MAG: glycosyltransferase family 1 protein, partial [bacterium]|nr:glycosyltransferase family 1 protein [bacterium]